MHPLIMYLLLFPLAADADVFKCIDNAGKVTYTNLPCAKAGLKESKLIPPPPPPALDPQAAKASRATEAAEDAEEAGRKSVKVSKKHETTSLELMASGKSNDKKCNKLNDDVGKTMDDMDANRRQGYTPQQEAAWNDKLKKLQAEKSRLGCF
jgi:hypothetical protein